MSTPNPAMVQRVAADVVKASPTATPAEQKAGALAAVSEIQASLDKAKPYVTMGQSLMAIVAVGGFLWANAKAVHGKLRGKVAQG